MLEPRLSIVASDLFQDFLVLLSVKGKLRSLWPHYHFLASHRCSPSLPLLEYRNLLGVLKLAIYFGEVYAQILSSHLVLGGCSIERRRVWSLDESLEL